MQNSPESVILIQDLELLRVISDPLRLKIFRTVASLNRAGDLCSVKRVSEELGIPPAKLYYHVKMLENHGLLEAAETRIVSGIVEKLYRVTAQRISVSNELFESEKDRETLYPMFAGVINEVLEDIRYTLQAPQNDNLNQNLAIGRQEIRLPKSRMAEFSEKLGRLLEEMPGEETPSPDDEIIQYTFFYACFPEVKKFSGNVPDMPGSEDRA